MSSLGLKRVLITGAAHGMGRAMARRFGEAGCEVVLTDLDPEALEEAGAEVGRTGARWRSYSLDVTDAEAIAEVRGRLHREAGGVDVLVNNAGVVHGGPFLEVGLERHVETLRVNVEGVVAMTHAFLPDLLEAPRGHAVFLASASGFVGLPNGTTYAASKWAVIGFAESVRSELRRQGRRHVDVTIVCPTYVATGMFDGAEPPRTTRFLQPDEVAAKVVEAVEHRRVWVLEPWIVKITPFLRSALPTAVGDLVADAFGVSTSMESWKGGSRG